MEEGGGAGNFLEVVGEEGTAGNCLEVDEEEGESEEVVVLDVLRSWTHHAKTVGVSVSKKKARSESNYARCT